MNMRRITVMITMTITGGRGTERLDKFVEGCAGSGAEVFDEWEEEDQMQEEGEKQSSVGGGWVGWDTDDTRATERSATAKTSHDLLSRRSHQSRQGPTSLAGDDVTTPSSLLRPLTLRDRIADLRLGELAGSLTAALSTGAHKRPHTDCYP